MTGFKAEDEVLVHGAKLQNGEHNHISPLLAAISMHSCHQFWILEASKMKPVVTRSYHWTITENDCYAMFKEERSLLSQYFMHT